MVNSVTNVVVISIWGMPHVYQVSLYAVHELSLYNWLEWGTAGLRLGFLTCRAGLAEFLHISTWAAKVFPVNNLLYFLVSCMDRFLSMDLVHTIIELALRDNTCAGT